MKRWIAGLFTALLVLYNGTAAAATSAAAACVMEQSTGRVLFSYNADAKLPMASTTKVMTALLVFEQGNLSDEVVCTKNAYGVPGTSIYLNLGEKLTLEQMVTGLMLASGNDAAVAIAEHLGGSVEGFAQMMNERAKALGADNTHFITPHGLPMEGHYTTARDLTLIARQAMTIPRFRDLVSTQRASIPWEGRDYDRQLRNKNRLLSDYPGATGIKTGFTRAAGRCLAFGARRDGMELVGVVLNCGDWFDEAERLMDTCFEAYDMLTLFRAGQDARAVGVSGGMDRSVRAVSQTSLSVPVREGEEAKLVVDLPDTVQAPVYAGMELGTASAVLNGETLLTVPLVAARSVQAESFMTNIKTILLHWPLLGGAR
ncbi:D-alanyl-D-alanine carboxypeptidase family protein [Beduinella massiliensis]|uniref:D-alanyl-D-alanine carboxypeptidase family protein n=1 Tax=Beduinella massiliensis TaxID=1852363 RepID=UPI0031F8145E